jgi:hypothetical protein
VGILPFLTGASPLNHSTHYLEHQALGLTSSSVHSITSHYAGGARLYASARAQPLLALLWVLSLPIPVILLSLHLALSGWCSTLRVGTPLSTREVLPGFVSPQSRDTQSRLWVRLPPFPTSSSQKSSVLSLSRWHRSTLSQRSFAPPLVDTCSTSVGTFLSWGFEEASLLGILSPSLFHATPITGLASKSLHCGREFASRSHQPLCT